jgi:ribosomal protein L37E
MEISSFFVISIELEKNHMQCRICGAILHANNQACSECGSPIIVSQQGPTFNTKTKTSSNIDQHLGSSGSSPDAGTLSHTPTRDTPALVRSRRLKKKLDLLAGIIVGILIFVAIGALIIMTIGTISLLTIPLPPQTPSGQMIDQEAAKLIADITTTESANLLTAKPGPASQTFKKNTPIYVTFRLNSKNFDFRTYKVMYVQAKFYQEKTFVYQLMLVFDHQKDGGFFAVQYDQPAKGSVELYSCLKSDCSDGKLAQTASFTITA